MRIAIGSDEKSELTDALVAELEKRDHEVVAFGPVASRRSECGSDCASIADRPPGSRRGTDRPCRGNRSTPGPGHTFCRRP